MSAIGTGLNEKVDDLNTALKLAIREGAQLPAEVGQLIADVLGDVSDLAASSGEGVADLITGKLKAVVEIIDTALTGAADGE